MRSMRMHFIRKFGDEFMLFKHLDSQLLRCVEWIIRQNNAQISTSNVIIFEHKIAIYLRIFLFSSQQSRAEMQ